MSRYHLRDAPACRDRGVPQRARPASRPSRAPFDTSAATLYRTKVSLSLRDIFYYL